MKFYKYILLLFGVLQIITVSAQQSDSVINHYFRVIELFNKNKLDPDTLRFDTSSYITSNFRLKQWDTIIIHQAKGTIWDYNLGSQKNYKFTGYFEFHIIGNIKGDTIFLLTNLLNRSNIFDTLRYDTTGLVQIIKVPTYQKYSVTKQLSASSWDGTKGGILALIADTLELKANIDVSGKGFHGADTTSNFSNGDCSLSPDSNNFKKSNFSFWDYNYSGLKGESVVVFDSTFIRGKMPLDNGGGGGNGYHSGGGGGANSGLGGIGGVEANKCIPINTNVRGQGGKSLKLGILNDTIAKAVFGGGGGGSTHAKTYKASKGGNGGGIIIFMANVVNNTGNFNIIANGQNVTDTATAGAGGGGGGGAIIMDVNKFIGNQLGVQIRGGNGGTTHGPDGAGPGGGGGGGYLLYSNLPPLVKVDLKFGSKGANDFGFGYAISGDYGSTTGNLIMPVKEFFFNIMPANQEICEGDTPAPLEASKPKGGTPKGGKVLYYYTWIKSTDLSHWDTIVNNDTIMYIYQPPPLDSTTYYIRIVKSDTIKDKSNVTTIKILPKIKSNIISISGHDTLCFGTQFPQLKGLKPSGGNGVYNYTWQDSTNISGWKKAFGRNDTLGYLSNNTTTTKFRRIVNSRECYDTTTFKMITVLPPLINNTVIDTQWISKGVKPNPLKGIAPVSGGNGSYIYYWQQRSNSTNWDTASGTFNNNNYVFDSLTITRFYRRLVFSGQDSACRDTSNILTIHIIDALKNDSLFSKDTTICGNTSPGNFIGNTPGGGDGVYNYQWEKSPDALNWDSITTITSTIFNPGIIDPGNSVHITTFKYFRRIALSGLYRGRYYCCKDTSDTIMVTVRPFIKNNLIDNFPNDTICYNQKPDSILAELPIDGEGAYKYRWQISENGKFGNIPAPGDTIQKDYYIDNLKTSTYIRRKVISGICIGYSDTLKITVLPSIGNNLIDTSLYICFGLKPDLIKGKTVFGGEGKNYRYLWLRNDSIWWSPADVPNTDSTYQPDTLKKKIYFRRVVKSGLHDCCTDTSNVLKFNIYDLPTVNMTSFNDSLCLNNEYPIYMTLTGKENFLMRYSDGLTDTFEVKDINTYTYTLDVLPTKVAIYNYNVVSVIDGNQCSAKDIKGSGTLSVFKTPETNAGGNDSVCGLKFVLKAVPDVGKGTWTSNTHTQYSDSTSASTSATVDSFGVHSFTWHENNGNCINSATVYITFYDHPHNVFAGSDTTYPFLFQDTLHAQKPIVGRGVWSTKDSTIEIDDPYDSLTYVSKLKFGKNYFIWTVSNGVCPSVNDTVIITALNIRIPQGISPNNDHKNDKFVIKGLENIKDADLTILNRSGTVVYHSSDYKNDWNGTDNGKELPIDTYYYILKVIGRTYRGYILLRR